MRTTMDDIRRTREKASATGRVIFWAVTIGGGIQLFLFLRALLGPLA